MDIAQGIRSHRVLGLRGIAALAMLRLAGFPKTLSVEYGAHRLHLRMKTTDVGVYESVLIDKQYDFALPFEPRVVVDAGANIGTASVFFANKYPNARIIAIEAERANFEMLKRNVAPYPQITPVHVALWNRDGQVQVFSPQDAGEWAFAVKQGEGVRAVTIPTLLRQFEIPKIDILKMDIEGAEVEVLENCDWAGRVRCLMIETHDRMRPGCSQAVAEHFGTSAIESGEIAVFIGRDI